jgi:glycosyltransferase involved in cell wall biosynthesis
MHEHPSVSQSFVVNEAAAVGRLGIRVLGYALNVGAAARPAAEIPMLRTPPPKSTLGPLLPAASVRALPRREGLTRAEFARLVLAMAHASAAVTPARRHGVTHIHAHFLGRPADVAAALSRRLGCTWTAAVHGDDVYAPTEPGLLRLRLREVAAVACASEDVRAHVAAHAEATGTEVAAKVVRCGVDTSFLRPNLSLPNQPHVITVGRLVETKGYRTAFAAIAESMESNPSLKWTIVGDGPLRGWLEGAVANRKLEERIRLVGALDHSETLALMTEAKVLVLPCERGRGGDSDGIPVVLMEAMALGVPVVTTSIGGIRELVEPDVNGYLVPPEDPAALGAAVRRILDPITQAELDRVRELARATIESKFDQSREARSLLELVNSIRSQAER